MADFDRLWVWDDPALANTLGWTREVAVNAKPAGREARPGRC